MTVIRTSVKRAILKHINAYIVVSVRIFVQFVKANSVIRAVSKGMDEYTVVSVLILVMTVIRPSVN
jgi:hypothetical protein